MKRLSDAAMFAIATVAVALFVSSITTNMLHTEAIVQAAQGTTATPASLADVTGDGSKHQFTTSHIIARSIQFICPSANSSTPIRIGDINISSSRGDACAAGGGLFKPELFVPPRTYDLSTFYYLAASNDKVTITYIQ